MTTFLKTLEELKPEIETTLDGLLPDQREFPGRLHEAMRYSVLAGGKRIRPALVVLVGEAFGGRREDLLVPAAATELLHTYSLVHDDLPAMDDDDLRRGRPSLHRQFDEATAILAGDALLTLGLTLLATSATAGDPEQGAKAIRLVGEAIGSRGMIGGQVDDLEAERRWPEDPAAALDAIHDRKTGALLAACCRLGGLLAGADEGTDAALGELGLLLGRLFQIADDILDREGSEASLGKTVGKDAMAHKLTYPALYGLEGSRRRLEDAAARAGELAAGLPGDPALWSSLVHFFATRDR